MTLSEEKKKTVRKLKIISKSGFAIMTAVFIIAAACVVIFADFEKETAEILSPVIFFGIIYIWAAVLFHFAITIKISGMLVNDVDPIAYCYAMEACQTKRALKKLKPYLDAMRTYYSGDFENAKSHAALLLTSRQKPYRFAAYNMLTRIAFFQKDTEAAKRNLDFLRKEKYSPACGESISFDEALIACLEGDTDRAVEIIESTKSTGKGKSELMAVSAIKGIVYFYADKKDEAVTNLSMAKSLGKHTFVAEYCGEMLSQIINLGETADSAVED